MNDRSALTLPERLEVEAAIDLAFAPLRSERSGLSALRVRAAVRWGRGREAGPPAALRWSGAIRRLSELSVAVGMSALMFGAALGPALPETRPQPLPAAAPVARASGPSVEVQREVLGTKHEWLDALRARVEALYTPFHDMLDPTVPRPALRTRADLPVPGGDRAGRSDPY